MQLFKTEASTQRFLTTHTGIYNTFYAQPHLVTRSYLRRFRRDAAAVWADATAAA